MNDSEIPVTLQDWPLQEKDITSDLCKRCGMCCEITLGVDETDYRQVEFLRAVVENYSFIEYVGDGCVSLRCSHLKQTKLSDEDPHWECSIYDDRPQLCKDYNCVSWAKVSNDLTLYSQVLEKAGIAKTQTPALNFTEELRGPD